MSIDRTVGDTSKFAFVVLEGDGSPLMFIFSIKLEKREEEVGQMFLESRQRFKIVIVEGIDQKNIVGLPRV